MLGAINTPAIDLVNDLSLLDATKSQTPEELGLKRQHKRLCRLESIHPLKHKPNQPRPDATATIGLAHRHGLQFNRGPLRTTDFRKNLFPDGGLESGDPALPSWPWPQEEFLSLSRDAGFLVGSYSLFLKKERGRRAVYALSSTLPVRPGKVYQVVFWGKADRNASSLLTFESLKKEFVVSQEWSRGEWEFSVPAGFPRMGRMRVAHQGDVPGEVYLDDFVFREKADLPQ